MTAKEFLELARAGDVQRLTADPVALADAVRELVASGDGASALELVGRAWRAWLSSPKLEEGRAAAASALAATQDAHGVWRARALYGDGVLAFRAGDTDGSRARNEELLELAAANDDIRGECDALTGLARVALRQGDYASVVRYAAEGRAKARLTGDIEAEAAPLHLEAAGARLSQRYDTARALYMESLELNQRLGAEPFVAMERHNLGWVDLHRGDIDAAEFWFRERDASSPPDAYGDAWVQLNWAAVACARGNVDEARQRYGAGKAALQRLGVTLDPDDQAEFDWLTAQIG